MCYQLKTNNGATEAVIDDNCGISKFYAIATKYKDYFLTLHYSIFNGVSILPQHLKSIKKDSNAVMEVANYLVRMAY
jgi:hypothetical protein